MDPLTHGPRFGADGSVTFHLWAPTAEKVELVVGGRRQFMDRDERGWCRATVSARHGDDYAFVLDGGNERPDPASRWQPDGVHGRSRLFDAGAVAWSDGEARWQPPPLAGAVIYELHVGTFTPAGTFAAAAEQLAGLADLGVTHVEVMPVNAFNGERGWGYDGVDWYAAHQPYGGPEGFAAFVDAAHRAGLAVVLDVVYNHLGPSGNYLGEFGPYLTEAYTTPWGDALNLDGPGSDAVRAFIVGNARHWLADFHVDALRLDAVHGLIDTSAVPILAEMSAEIAALETRLGRPLALIAESDRCDPLTVQPRALGGAGLDGQWADDLHHAIHTAITGERDGYYTDYDGLRDLVRAYRRGFVYDGRYSAFRERTVGARVPDDVPGWRLVACIQNHDQVGNRALGERLTTLVDPELVKVGILLLCAAPTTPMLFMGEEYGEIAPFQYFTSHPENDLAEAVRKGRAEEFASFTSFAGADVPDPQDPETARRSTLDWSLAETAEGKARRALWRDLLALRRSEPALGNGRRDLVAPMHIGTHHFAVLRRDPQGADVLIAANLGDEAWEIPVIPALRPAWTLLRASTDEVTAVTDALRLPPATAALWRAAG